MIALHVASNSCGGSSASKISTVRSGTGIGSDVKGNQSQAISRMWAAGLSAQSSVYGQTIPVFYGCTRAAGLLTIWMQELRKGSSGKKAKKKGQTTYIENVDFLVGHNPIAS